MMPPLRFIFLGTGTSGGIPVIACDCPVCTSADPHDKRTRQGAAIQWIDPTGQPRTVLIDATPDLRQQALRHDLWRCDAIFLTHHHVDHVFGLDDVRRFNIAMRAPIDIYAEQHTLTHVKRIYKHIFDRASNENDSFVATLNTHTIQPHTAIDLHALRFTAFRLMHGNLPILGYRIEATHPSLQSSPVLPLAYCTDTSAIPDESRPLLTNLTNLVLDGLRPRPHPTHFSVDQATAEAQRIDAKQTFLVHIGHEIKHADVDTKLKAQTNNRVRLAYDALTLGDTSFNDRPTTTSDHPNTSTPTPDHLRED